MAKSEKYYLGPKLLSQVRDVISRVGGMPAKTSAPSFGECFQELQRPSASGGALKLGVSVSEWPKDSLGNVRVLDQGTALFESSSEPPTILEDCVNKLIDVEDGDIVVVGRILGRWYLVSAECG